MLIFYSDKAWFHLNAYANTQNNRYCDSIIIIIIIISSSSSSSSSSSISGSSIFGFYDALNISDH